MLKDPDLRQIALWKLEGYTNRRSPSSSNAPPHRRAKT